MEFKECQNEIPKFSSIQKPKSQIKMLTTNQTIARYSTPNETGKGYLTVINLPYPMRLAWDLDIKVTRMSCHKDVADDMLQLCKQMLDTRW